MREGNFTKEDEFLNEFMQLQFEVLEPMTGLVTEAAIKKRIEDIVKDIKDPNAKISLLYIVFSSHGHDSGAVFSDTSDINECKHLLELLEPILGLMKDYPVVLNSSFCRNTKADGGKMPSPMLKYALNQASYFSNFVLKSVMLGYIYPSR